MTLTDLYTRDRRTRKRLGVSWAAVFAMLLLAGCTAEAARDTASSPAVTREPAAASSGATSPAPATQAPPAEPPAPAPAPAPPRARVKLHAAVITRVVDGDTAWVRMKSDGRTEKVRFIGVDTPENTTKVEPYGVEASAYARKHLKLGRRVFLEKDAEERDRYGRLLAYVWLSKPVAGDPDTGRPTIGEIKRRMFNARLLVDGYGQILTIPPNVKYVDEFLDLERAARRDDRGLWDPALAGASASGAGSGGGGGGRGGSATYIGNRNTMKFHYADCSSVGDMNPANKVPMNSRSEAISAGYVPCKRCNP